MLVGVMIRWIGMETEGNLLVVTKKVLLKVVLVALWMNVNELNKLTCISEY